MNINITKKQKGFTLIELLVVIGIIAVLFAVVLIAIDPAKRLKQSRDSTRLQSVTSILEAVTTYIVDNYGVYPNNTNWAVGTVYSLGTATGTACGTTVNNCASASSPSTTTTQCMDLGPSLVPNYLSSIPLDPSSGTAATSGFAVVRNSAGRVNVIACGTEGTSTISVQR